MIQSLNLLQKFYCNQNSDYKYISTLTSILVLPEAVQDRINVDKALFDFGFWFGSGEDDFAIDKDEKNHARLDHSIDEAWEQFRFVWWELTVHLIEVLQADGKTKIDSCDEILHLEIDELHVVSQFLDDASELSCGEICVVLVSGSCAH